MVLQYVLCQDSSINSRKRAKYISQSLWQHYCTCSEFGIGTDLLDRLKTTSLRGFLILWYNSENMLKWTSDKSKKLRNYAVNTVVPLFFAVLFGICMFWPKTRFLGHNFNFFTKTWITLAREGLRPSFRAHSDANSPFYKLRKNIFKIPPQRHFWGGKSNFRVFENSVFRILWPNVPLRYKIFQRILVH